MKNNEKRLVKITRENQQLFSRCIPDTFKKVLFQKGMNAVGIVAWDGQGCGAAVSTLEEGDIRILSVYVEPEYRRMGMGTELVRALQGFVSKAGQGTRRLRIEYPYPKMGEMELFLFRCGFQTEAEGNQIYYVPVRHVQDLDLLKKSFPLTEGEIIVMREMPEEQKIRWLRRFCNDLPQSFSPRQAGGALLEENSFLYMNKGTADGFVICSHLEDDSIYLAVLYSEKKAVKALPALLRAALSSLLPRYEDKILCFAAATHSGRQLAEHLCRGHEEKIRMETMRTSVWRAEDPDRQVEYDPLGEVNLIPRLNGLSAVLDDMGIAHSIRYPEPEAYPGIQADIEGKNILLAYALAAPAGEDKFVLNLLYQVPKGEKEFFALALACQRFNLRSRFVSAIPDMDSGQVFIRWAVPEVGGVADSKTITVVTGLFLDGIRQFEKEFFS